MTDCIALLVTSGLTSAQTDLVRSFVSHKEKSIIDREDIQMA